MLLLFSHLMVLSTSIMFELKFFLHLMHLTALVALIFSRSDGGVYCHSYDEGFSHGFVLVRMLTTCNQECLVMSFHHQIHPFSLQALCADHPQTFMLPEKVQNQATLHMERALVR